MKNRIIILSYIFVSVVNSSNYIYLHPFRSLKNYNTDYLITVIGAGGAGTSFVGVCLDLGIAPEKILWIDRDFNAGRLSSYYNVPANTKHKYFVEFFESCKAFRECAQEQIDEMKKLDLEKEHALGHVVEPLKAITSCLMNKVQTIKGNLQSLYFEDNAWKVEINNKKISSYSVVLATGSHPKTLEYPEVKDKEIPLDIALDKNQLEEILNPDDTVAVVGSSHSAILILKYLSEINVKKVINFYNKPIVYAIDMGTWTLNASTGLKGLTAQWAKNVLEKNPPSNLIRLESNDETLKEILPSCTKIIYAIGFERNEIPTNIKINYDPTTGIIAPRLFGIGIAFPEKIVNPAGITEYYVGIDVFMEYAQRMAPIWLKERSIKFNRKKSMKLLRTFKELFNLEIL